MLERGVVRATWRPREALRCAGDEAKMSPPSSCCKGLLQVPHHSQGLLSDVRLTRLPRGAQSYSESLLFPDILPRIPLLWGFPTPPSDWPFSVPSDGIPIQPPQTIRGSFREPYPFHSIDRFQNHPLSISVSNDRHQELNGEVVEKVGCGNKHEWRGREGNPEGEWYIE